MYTTEDFTEIDKSRFKCYKFPNGDIYHGNFVNDKMYNKEIIY